MSRFPRPVRIGHLLAAVAGRSPAGARPAGGDARETTRGARPQGRGAAPWRGFIASGVLIAFLVGACSGARRRRDPQLGRPAAIPPQASVSGLPLEMRRTGSFRFLVAGHLYGRPGKTKRGLSRSFVAAIGRLGDLKADLLISAGDIFHSTGQAKTAMAELASLGLPVLNAPGNHDLAEGSPYAETFGPCWYAFDHGACRFVILDTECDPWRISGEQLDFLRSQILDLERSGDARSLVCVGHRVLFGIHPRNWVASLHSNAAPEFACGRPPDLGPGSFHAEVMPLLRDLARHRQVVFITGDVGAFAEDGLPLYFEKEPDRDLTWIATGLGDYERDLVLIGNVDERGSLRFEAFHLADGRRSDPAEQGYATWMARFHPSGPPAAILAFLEEIR